MGAFFMQQRRDILIKINNVTIPTPSNYSVGIMDLSQSYRTTNGRIIIELIGTPKRKIEMSWNFLSQTDLASLLQKIKAPTGSISGRPYVFFSVEYIDPEDGTVRTGNFYVGDRTAGAIDYKDGVMRWKDIKFNFIEE